MSYEWDGHAIKKWSRIDDPWGNSIIRHFLYIGLISDDGAVQQQAALRHKLKEKVGAAGWCV